MQPAQIDEIDRLAMTPRVTISCSTDPDEFPLFSQIYYDPNLKLSDAAAFALIIDGKAWCAWARMEGDALVLSGDDRPDWTISGMDLMNVKILGAVTDIGTNHQHIPTGKMLIDIRFHLELDRVEAAELLDTTPRMICDIEEGLIHSGPDFEAYTKKLKEALIAHRAKFIGPVLPAPKSGPQPKPKFLNWATDEDLQKHSGIQSLQTPDDNKHRFVSKTIIKALGLTSGHVLTFSVVDSRMAPLFSKGRDALIDTTSKTPPKSLSVQSHPFLVKIGMRAVLAHVAFTNGTYLLSFLDARITPEIHAEKDVEVIGQAVFQLPIED